MKETLASGQLVEALFAAAKAEKWGEVDQELVPQLAALNGNELAKLLLSRVGDTDSNIRDVVATAINRVTITGKELQRTTVLAMCNMSINDGDRYPAGRAAAFCVGHEQDTAYDLRLRALMKSAIKDFPLTAMKRGWDAKVLLENIPTLSRIPGLSSTSVS